jgi:hypothetical protein
MPMASASDDAHAHRLGEGGELRADIAVTHDAERLAAHFVAVGRGLVPAAGMRRGRLGEYPPEKHDDLGDGQFGDAARVRERRVEHRDAAARGRVEVDLVRADREAPDRKQLVGAFENRARQLRARADAEDVHAL